MATESESRTEGRGVVQTGGLAQAGEALPDRHIALRRPGAEDGAGLRSPLTPSQSAIPVTLGCNYNGPSHL